MKNERKRNIEQEDVLDAGRDLGSLAKTAPDLWEWVKMESTKTGRKKHEVLKDAIARYIIEREVIARGLTMEQMLAAWEIKDLIEGMLIEKVVKFGTNFIQGFLMTIGDLINAITYERQRQLEQVLEEEKKKDIDYQMKRTQAQLASTLIQAMMPAIMATLKQIHPALKTSTIPTTQQEQETTQMELEVIEDGDTVRENNTTS
ncbi:MAG: hypothetical protein QXV82_09960 [Ignisphaera sp.]